jgi:IS1 family transposase
MKRTIHTVESLQARTIEEGDCWLWQGYCGNKTPQVMYHTQGKRKMYSVRRLIRELQTGRAQADGHYTNSCGNHLCVSPNHVLYKTVKNHLRDMAKGRTHTPVTSFKKRQVRIDLGLTKLDMKKAEEIRASNLKLRELADEYKVNISMIKRIRNNKAWKPLSSPFSGLFK